jgi:integrin alpha FG-GAP repeat containing protein 1
MQKGRTWVLALLAISSAFAPAAAIWPFPPKRFRGNALIGTGSMGLDPDGSVVAFGDFDGNQL